MKQSLLIAAAHASHRRHRAHRIDRLMLVFLVLLHDAVQVLFLLLLGDKGEQVFLAANEVLVPEALSVLRVARLVEVVHVQLADEAGEIVVFEVLWQHFIGEFIGFVHDKARSIRLPCHSGFIGRVLHKERTGARTRSVSHC